MASTLREAVVGSLTALAAGDCLVLPVEGQHPDDIRRWFGRLTDLQYPLTAWSDDTQQALVLIELLVRGR
jgi:ADP-ribosylglycohydrolase